MDDFYKKLLKLFQDKDCIMIFNHIDNVTVSAKFSECGKYRYSLEIELNNNNKSETACVIMQNPSVANQYIADKSVQFIEKLFFIKNYPELLNVKKIIIVNLFAYIQTNDFKGKFDHIGEENNDTIKSAFAQSSIILVAWGNDNSFKNRKDSIKSLLKNINHAKIYKSKAHPSRASYINFIHPYQFS